VFSHHLSFSLPYGFFRGSTFRIAPNQPHIELRHIERCILENCLWLNEAMEKLNAADKMPKRFMSKPYGDGQSQPAKVICFHLSLVLENYHQFFCVVLLATLMPRQPFSPERYRFKLFGPE
jgi:hypothetical protein